MHCLLSRPFLFINEMVEHLHRRRQKGILFATRSDSVRKHDFERFRSDFTLACVLSSIPYHRTQVWRRGHISIGVPGKQEHRNEGIQNAIISRRHVFVDTRILITVDGSTGSIGFRVVEPAA